MLRKSAARQYYINHTCRCAGILFHVIVIPPDLILHLTYSIGDHRQAIRELERMFSGIKEQDPVNEEVLCEDLLKQVVTGKVIPKVDFINNPFLNRGTPFQKKIWKLISRIKPGETTTYGELAAAAGSAGAARAAGQACNRNPLALIIPCHRVVAANGPGGFAGDLSIKLKLLEMENLELRTDR